jgi:hypothetical protein
LIPKNRNLTVNKSPTYVEFPKAHKEIADSTMSALIKIDNELRTNAAMQNPRANQAATDALKMQSQQLQIHRLRSRNYYPAFIVLAKTLVE